MGLINCTHLLINTFIYCSLISWFPIPVENSNMTGFYHYDVSLLKADFLSQSEAVEQAINTDITLQSYYGKCVSKQMSVKTSSRHLATIAFIWSSFSGHIVNLSLIFTLTQLFFFFIISALELSGS